MSRAARYSVAETRSGEVGIDVVDRQLNGGDLFCLFVRDFSLEFFLERHDQLYCVEGICTQIVNE